MSAQDRYTKIIESLVNGEEAKASDLLHEAFVEKAREIWTDLVEQDELAEEEIEELEEAFGEDEDEDFLNDIESDEEEIEAEEAFGEAEEEDEDMIEPEAELELADGEEEMDFDADGEIDAHEEEHGDIEDKLVSVEDALADLKAEFAKLMGEEEAEEAGEEEMEMEFGDEEAEEEVEEEFTFEEAEEEVEELDEAAELKKIGKENAIHPVEMPNGEDGKASPVKDAGNDMAKPVATDTKKEAGGKAPAPKAMTGFKHPGEGADMKAEPKGHGAEKKGKAE